MIEVDRGTQPPALELEQARYFDYVRPHLVSAQRGKRGEAPPELDNEVLYEQGRPVPMQEVRGVSSTLIEAFHAKCAYCEIRAVDEKGLVIHRHRPPRDSMNSDGAVSKLHYWWMAYDWENLLPVCVDCVRSKGNRFPVEGPRLTWDSGNSADERALLLDPTAAGFRDTLHFEFDADGNVEGLTERAVVTIDTLALNRPELVESRGELWAEMDSRRRTALREDRYVEWVESNELPSNEFSALRRQFVASMPGIRAKESLERIIRLQRSKDDTDEDPTGDRELQNEADSSPDDESQPPERPAPDISSRRGPAYFAAARYVERVKIENFRAIDDLTIDVSTKSDDAPWTILLGENGSAKSSVLQAIALALSGNAGLERLRTWTVGETPVIQPDDFIRVGADTARVSLKISQFTTPVELIAHRGGEWRVKNLPKILAVGYGATRLLPSPGAIGRQLEGYVHVANLFNPFVALGDANKWLSELTDEHFEMVASRIDLLLHDDRERPAENNRRTRLVRQTNGHDRDSSVRLMQNGALLRLSQLSDGYNSMIALACDLCHVAFNAKWKNPELAEGLVLLDEIGVHLHPRWQMQIVSRLRQAFPRLQFIATTHQPLCLRGLNDGEVIATSRSDGTVSIDPELPKITGLRVDQILTSSHFGLHSTTDPESEMLLTEYYALLAIPERSDTQQDRLDALMEKLDELRLLGRDRRERLMLQVIDEYLAVSGSSPEDVDVDELKAETKATVARLWDRVGFDAGEL